MLEAGLAAYGSCVGICRMSHLLRWHIGALAPVRRLILQFVAVICREIGRLGRQPDFFRFSFRTMAQVTVTNEVCSSSGSGSTSGSFSGTSAKGGRADEFCTSMGAVT